MMYLMGATAGSIMFLNMSGKRKISDFQPATVYNPESPPFDEQPTKTDKTSILDSTANNDLIMLLE
jgi:hypothetical protein